MRIVQCPPFGYVLNCSNLKLASQIFCKSNYEIICDGDTGKLEKILHTNSSKDVGNIVFAGVGGVGLGLFSGHLLCPLDEMVYFNAFGPHSFLIVTIGGPVFIAYQFAKHFGLKKIYKNLKNAKLIALDYSPLENKILELNLKEKIENYYKTKNKELKKEIYEDLISLYNFSLNQLKNEDIANSYAAFCGKFGLKPKKAKLGIVLNNIQYKPISFWKLFFAGAAISGIGAGTNYLIFELISKIF